MQKNCEFYLQLMLYVHFEILIVDHLQLSIFCLSSKTQADAVAPGENTANHEIKENILMHGLQSFSLEVTQIVFFFFNLDKVDYMVTLSLICWNVYFTYSELC